jgi:hypothetical protein
MKIQKSVGTTPSEQTLASLCERSFLKLWSYPNPFNEDGKELCDLLVVFEDQVIIYFDRDAVLPLISTKEPQVLWDRWRKKVIDKQLNTARGAARYILNGGQIFLDAKREIPFPLSLNLEKIKIQKIIVAHGAKEACLGSSESNVFGSLAIVYSADPPIYELPFLINLDKEDPIHVFDSHNLPILLGELDTIADFTNYLSAKVEAIRRLDMLSYCGEEDLLAHYLLNFDAEAKRHYIGTKDSSINGVAISEGEWKDFIEMPMYARTKAANKVSYLWDDIIQDTSQNTLDGTLMGSSPLLGRSAILEMAKEPRFMRRSLSEMMRSAVVNFPETAGFSRNVTLMASVTPKKAYVLLQLRPPEDFRIASDYRAKRQTFLEIACAAAKNKLPVLETIVGIAIDAPKFVKEDGEDFILMDCKDWSEETRKYYELLNKDWGFFQSPSLQQREMHATEFIHPTPARPAQRTARPVKTGRNEICPCGSGKKFKKCCSGTR